MAELDPAFEQQLAGLSDDDWRSLSARVRPPTSSNQLRDIAGRILKGDALDSFVAVADPRKFANSIGDVDEQRVMGHLTALFGAGQGQDEVLASGPARPGDRGRAEAARRSSRQLDPENAATASDTGPGAGGRAEAARRNQNRKGQQ